MKSHPNRQRKLFLHPKMDILSPKRPIKMILLWGLWEKSWQPGLISSTSFYRMTPFLLKWSCNLIEKKISGNLDNLLSSWKQRRRSDTPSFSLCYMYHPVNSQAASWQRRLSALSNFKSPSCPQEEEGKRDQWTAVELRTAPQESQLDLTCRLCFDRNAKWEKGRAGLSAQTKLKKMRVWLVSTWKLRSIYHTLYSSQSLQKSRKNFHCLLHLTDYVRTSSNLIWLMLLTTEPHELEIYGEDRICDEMV